ncbi:hypothetical protein [Sphingomonas jaspsi]|uniref:hypothetical protein n=1 Tax=Sphingomonas jaspsi TaxID=392409 RepID=UPI0004B85718|nr:hypothetical protein [Sphingomonas jaspsi]
MNTDTGEVVQSCDIAQQFRVSADRRRVELTERGVKDFRATYDVIKTKADRIFMKIENEDRLTESGKPVTWWAMFEGPNQFRWRRDDWPMDGRTGAWQRCGG